MKREDCAQRAVQSLQGASAVETDIPVKDSRPTDAEQTAVMNARDIAAANVMFADEKLANTGNIDPVLLKDAIKAEENAAKVKEDSSKVKEDPSKK